MKTLIPIASRRFPKKIAKHIVNVQPMTDSINNIFNIRYEYDWTKWRPTISIWPRRSINNKIIFGWINKRSREDGRPVNGDLSFRYPSIKEFATDKELFIAKLRGRK